MQKTPEEGEHGFSFEVQRPVVLTNDVLSREAFDSQGTYAVDA
jgi:hypothetical protein